MRAKSFFISVGPQESSNQGEIAKVFGVGRARVQRDPGQGAGRRGGRRRCGRRRKGGRARGGLTKEFEEGAIDDNFARGWCLEASRFHSCRVSKQEAQDEGDRGSEDEHAHADAEVVGCGAIEFSIAFQPEALGFEAIFFQCEALQLQGATSALQTKLRGCPFWDGGLGAW